MILLGVLAADLILRCLAARLILPIFERKPPFGGAPHADPTLGEQVLFPTTNGLWLCGRIYRHGQTPPRGVIVFCPEMEGDSTSALYYCAALLEAGFDVLGFDFRNQSASGTLAGYEPLHWPTEYEVEDTLSAVRYAQTREEWLDVSLGVVGISRGGGAALAAASRNHSIQRVVAEGAFSTERLMEHYTMRWAALYIPQWVMSLFPLWHVRGTLAIVRWLSQYRRNCRYVNLERELFRLRKTPILLIHGDRDSYVPKETALAIARRLPGPDVFWLVEKANHNKAREVDAEEYDRRLIEFFEPMSSQSDFSPDTSAATLPA